MTLESNDYEGSYEPFDRGILLFFLPLDPSEDCINHFNIKSKVIPNVYNETKTVLQIWNPAWGRSVLACLW